MVDQGGNSAMAVEPMRASPMVVAGGAGFLGSHLCERLLRLGHSVLCADNLTTGSLGNIEGLMEEPRFRLAVHDIAEPPAIEDPIGIFNLACPASPVHYQADPVRTTLTSVTGTYNLLEIARRCGAPLLQASTSEVYGDPAVHPQSECYWGYVNPAGVRSCYDEGKRCAESLCFDYRRTYGVDVRVARIFNTYGPRMAIGDGRVVTNFIVQALRNEPLTIYGNGSQTRSFCYVDDLIDGLLLLMGAPRGVKTPMNLGNPEEFTILELAEQVIELTGSRSRMVLRPLPGDDPTQRCPDIALARRELGWQPRVRLREGLKCTIEYLDGALSRAEAGAKTTLAPRKPRLSSTGAPGAAPGLRVRLAARQVSDVRGR
jgi:UDP-glucuronate decarboxylase